jgi:hypothetical protein
MDLLYYESVPRGYFSNSPPVVTDIRYTSQESYEWPDEIAVAVDAQDREGNIPLQNYEYYVVCSSDCDGSGPYADNWFAKDTVYEYLGDWLLPDFSNANGGISSLFVQVQDTEGFSGWGQADILVEKGPRVTIIFEGGPEGAVVKVASKSCTIVNGTCVMYLPQNLTLTATMEKEGYYGKTVSFSTGTADKTVDLGSLPIDPLVAMANANFTLIRTGGSCPNGFSDGMIRFTTELDLNADHLIGAVGDTFENHNLSDPAGFGITMRFCSTTETGQQNLASMDANQTGFMVLKNGGQCPANFMNGEIKFDTEDDSNADRKWGATGDSYLSELNTHSIFLLPCTYGGKYGTEHLKNAAFTLLKNGPCPEGFEEGYLFFDTEDWQEWPRTMCIDSYEGQCLDYRYYYHKDGSNGNIGSSALSDEHTHSVYLRTCSYTP